MLVSEAIVDVGAGGPVAVGTATARGNPAGGDATGVSDGLGDGALAALAGFSDSPSPSVFGEAFAFALAFLTGVARFLTTDFFFDTYLRAEHRDNQRTKDEDSSKPKAKTDHCGGA